MKTAFKLKLEILTLAALAFTACGQASTQESTPAGDNTPITHVAYHDLASNVVASPEGVYEVAWLRPGVCNLLYLDAASREEIFLCSNPSCDHSTEACSSYLEVGESGSSYNIFFTNDHLYALRNMGDSELPYILEMAPDGTERRTVVTLHSGERFTGNIYGYGNAVLCEISVVGEDNFSRVQLEKIDLGSGSREMLFRYPGEKGSSLSLLGAAGTCLYYLATDQEQLQYYAVDLSQGSAAFQNWQDHPVGPGFDGISQSCSVQEDYFCFFDTASNTVSYENLLTGEKVDFPALELASGDAINGLAHLFEDRFALVLYSAEQGSRFALLDPETHQLTGVEYPIAKNDSIDIVGEYEDWLIYQTRTAEMPLIDQDKIGLSGEVAYYNVYGMVEKENFWNGAIGREISFPEM